TDEKQMTSLVTNYIAERLVERERALAAQGMHLKPPVMPKAAESAARNDVNGARQDQAVVHAAAPAAAPITDAARSAQPAGQTPLMQPPVEPAAVKAGSQRAMPAVSTTAAPARIEAPRSGGWIWALLALIVGVGIGALALYLYAATLPRP
ncbi:MAG: hypothetical protein ACRCTI_19490, partial [Beijerinckiaceae bacterium]